MPTPSTVRGALALLATLLLATGTLAQGLPADDVDASVAEGQRIYEDGLLPGSGALSARAAGNVTLIGPAAACTNCHRRSGYGGREGELRVPPITGRALYSQPDASSTERLGRESRPVVLPRRLARPAYDDATLVRAITEGVDPSGAPLSHLMPRYTFSSRAVLDLVAYLRQLGARPDPGVAAASVRLATIVTDEAAPERVAAFLETLRAWAARGAVSGLATPLDVWRLTGQPATWPAQLAEYYARAPAFAVISGIAGAHWEPVAAFCETERLPCLFPQVDAAPEPHPGGYNYYLSPGVRLEGALLARFLSSAGITDVTQLAGDDAGSEAATAFRAGFGGRVSDLPGTDPAPTAMTCPACAVVAWLRPPQVGRLLLELPAGTTLYLSEQLAPPQQVQVPPGRRDSVRWISTRTDPVRLHALGLVGLESWLSSIGVPVRDERLQSELYAATWLVSDALARMRGNWSRDYLLESIEAGMPSPGPSRIYQGFSLATGQRNAVRGGRVLAWEAPALTRLVPASGLLLE